MLRLFFDDIIYTEGFLNGYSSGSTEGSFTGNPFDMEWDNGLYGSARGESFGAIQGNSMGYYNYR